jgi:hypothetical protein
MRSTLSGSVPEAAVATSEVVSSEVGVDWGYFSRGRNPRDEVGRNLARQEGHRFAVAVAAAPPSVVPRRHLDVRVAELYEPTARRSPAR